MTVLEFEVLGEPKPQGSKRAFAFKGKDGRLSARVIDDNPNTKAWRQEVASVARAAYLRVCPSGELITGPVVLSIKFVRPRPKGHFGAKGVKPSAPVFPTTKPDLTKLERAVEDALTSQVWTDDALVWCKNTQKVFGETYRTQVRVEAMK